MSHIEAISLLHLLHKVPARPSKNLPSITPVFPSESYSLPLEKERSLASGLAFLCGIFLDSFSVPALYIHENVQNESLQVFVAINKKDHNDPENILQDVTQRLQRVVSRLAVSDQGNNEDEIMSAIVIMCEEKIKDRMELTKDVDKSLQKSIQILLRTGSLTKKTKTKTRQLIARIDEYRKHQTVQRLVPIIEGAKTLSQTPNFDVRVETISNKILDPGQRTKIVQTLLKVAQYRDTARILYRAAKKFKAARNMQVIAVELPPETFTFATCTNTDLKSTLTRIQALPKHDKDYHRLTQIIRNQKSATPINPEGSFAEWCEKSQWAGKVHSEVQLIAYYEQHRLRPPPRVICASKKACFLCDAFIKLYAKFYTPRCHGRLYPGWKLPRSIGLDAQFAHVLEDMARQSVRTTLNQNKSIKFPDPLESSIFTRNSSKTTILPFGPEEANGTIVAEVELHAPPEVSIVDLKKADSVIEEVHEIIASASPEIDDQVVVSECVVVPTASPTRNPRPARLERGKSHTVTINSGSTLKLTSGIINFHFEYESKDDNKSIDCEVQWLAEQPSAGSEVIDAQSLQGELTVGETIYVSSATDYFLITIQ